MVGKIPLTVILGPTASGKTDLAVKLAEHFGGEIVSADSMQIYKGMDIATAKPSAEQLSRVPHHLIGVIGRDQKFSVADYVTAAKNVINDIHKRGKMPFLVGGTGLYINSVVDNIKFTEEKSDERLRAELYKQYDTLGAQKMYERLRKIDPEYAKTLHPNNKTRVLRGIEIYEQTGILMSEHLMLSRSEESPYNACMIGLNFENRSELYERINSRVDAMLGAGLLDEAKNIYINDKYSIKTAGQAIGIKELIPYFKGEISFDDAVERIKTESRRYAKRQMTWFRRDDRIKYIMIDKNDTQEYVFKNAKKIIVNFFEL